MLGGNEDGCGMSKGGVLELLRLEGLVNNSILIGEGWEGGGLYEVGRLGGYGKWCEWNGDYGDDVGDLVKGDLGFGEGIVNGMSGCEDI